MKVAIARSLVNILTLGFWTCRYWQMRLEPVTVTSYIIIKYFSLTKIVLTSPLVVFIYRISCQPINQQNTPPQTLLPGHVLWPPRPFFGASVKSQCSPELRSPETKQAWAILKIYQDGDCGVSRGLCKAIHGKNDGNFDSQPSFLLGGGTTEKGVIFLSG